MADGFFTEGEMRDWAESQKMEIIDTVMEDGVQKVILQPKTGVVRLHNWSPENGWSRRYLRLKRR